ncbi:hypothetical protein QFC21_002727 [Naganishia friedmannii]|uniref:Uncharacterized protein n=1 Tax=Naganishia friedmannii TaxID=89922 RepID=A0ACC2VTV6_9TREE|nr:hypothetical protein QFC21_002727 [Naganishia friedmannii]
MPFLRAILQRLPTTLHLAVAVFAIYGERLAPIAFTCFLWAMHLALINANLRTLYGVLRARQGVFTSATTDWRAKWRAVSHNEKLHYDDVVHAIVIPNYMEDIDTLRDTLQNLASHRAAPHSYIPVLGMELRETAASLKALQLVSEFKGSFKDVRYTLHPDGLSGEIAGKGSNLAWATRSVWMGMRPTTEESSRDGGAVVDERTRTVITVMDSDNHVPVGVRVTDIFWAMGGLSTLYEGSSAKIPTSAYSLSLCLAESVGGWDPDTFAIGEDMHMFIKCNISTRGNLVSETIYSPASQMDVMGNIKGGIRGFIGAHQARYKQAVRHLWGSLDIAYTLHRILTGDLQSHPDAADAVDQQDHVPISRRYGRLLGSPDSENHFPGYDYHTGKGSVPFSVSGSPTEALLDAYAKERFLSPILEEEAEVDLLANTVLPFKQDATHQFLPLLTMLYRIYEACLMMGNITIFVVARAAYSILVNQQVLTAAAVTEVPSVQSALYWSEKLRNLSGILLVVTALSYDRYHRYTAKGRWENDTANRLGAVPRDRSHRTALSALDYFALPATIIFGPIAMLHAHFMHVFTNRLRYTVSLKFVSRSTNATNGSYISMEESKQAGHAIV